MENGGRGHGKEEKAVGHLNDWRGKAFSGSRIMFAFMLMFYAALMTSQCHRGGWKWWWTIVMVDWF